MIDVDVCAVWVCVCVRVCVCTHVLLHVCGCKGAHVLVGTVPRERIASTAEANGAGH